MKDFKETTITDKIAAMTELIKLAAKINIEHDINKHDVEKFIISISEGVIGIDVYQYTNYGTPVFYSREAAKIAINILGEDTIRTAYTQF